MCPSFTAISYILWNYVSKFHTFRLPCPTGSEAYLWPCRFFQMRGPNINCIPNSDKIEFNHFCGHCWMLCMYVAFSKIPLYNGFLSIQFLKMQMKSVFVSQLLFKAILMVLLNLELDEWYLLQILILRGLLLNTIICMCKTGSLPPWFLKIYFLFGHHLFSLIFHMKCIIFSKRNLW